MGPANRDPLLNDFYQQFLLKPNAAAFSKKVAQHYTCGTLERLATDGQRMTRRAAVLALGQLADFESNAILGRALVDFDRGVRTLADSGIRGLWCRSGTDKQRRLLRQIIRLNSGRRFEAAMLRASDLVVQAPEFAEAWNQRGIARFSVQRFGESVKDCHQALELNPYHFGAACGMAQCYMQLEDRASALMSFRRALKLNPGLEAVRAQIVLLEKSLERRG